MHYCITRIGRHRVTVLVGFCIKLRGALFQIDLLPAEHRSSLLALLRIPLTIISCGGMLFLHSGSSDWQIVLMGCILLSLTTLCALLLHLVLSRNTPEQINDHFVLKLSTNVYDSQEDEDDLPQGLTVG